MAAIQCLKFLVMVLHLLTIVIAMPTEGGETSNPCLDPNWCHHSCNHLAEAPFYECICDEGFAYPVELEKAQYDETHHFE